MLVNRIKRSLMSFDTRLLRPFSSANQYVKFNYKDALNFDGLLTDEERMVEETARQYAQGKLLPRVVEAYQKEHFDVEIMREMGDLGFLGCTIEDYDLPGVSSVAYGKSFSKFLWNFHIWL